MAGIYIHIPFCHSKCAYCDFFSRPINRDIDGYIETLHKEYERRKYELAEPVTTVYLEEVPRRLLASGISRN